MSDTKVLDLKGDTLEIEAVFENAEKGSCGVRVRRSDYGSHALDIRCQGGGINVTPAVPDIVTAGHNNTQTVTVNITDAPGNPLANSRLFIRIVATGP